MPTITVRLLAGRTEEQKRDFTDRVREAAVETLGARAEKVKVEFHDEEPRQTPGLTSRPDIKH